MINIYNPENKDFCGYRYTWKHIIYTVAKKKSMLREQQTLKNVVILINKVIKIKKTNDKVTKNQHLLHVTHFFSNNCGYRIINLKAKTTKQQRKHINRGEDTNTKHKSFLWWTQFIFILSGGTCPSFGGHPHLLPFYNTQGEEPCNSLRLSLTEAYLFHIKWANVSYVV